MISLAGAALTPLFSSQGLSRPDFDYPPVLQQTAHSYCLDSHFSPVNPSLVNKRQSLDNSASGLSLVNWCDKTLTERTSLHQTQQNESAEGRLALQRAVASLRQQGWDPRSFAQFFWTMARGLEYDDAVLDLEVFNDEEVFNLVLDDPLP